MRPGDEELSQWLADAAPRAPRGTAERVLARVRSARALRIRVWTSASLAVAAAALLLLLVGRTRPHAPATAHAESRTLLAGQSWTVGDPLAGVRLDGPAEARSDGNRLFVQRGTGRLSGHGAQLDSPPALLTAQGVGAQVDFEVSQGAAAPLLAVHVLAGGARLDPHGTHAPTLLGPGDRALLSAGAPPLTVRAPRPAPSSPTGSARQEASTTTPSPPTHAAAQPPVDEPALALDKDDVTTVIRGLLPQIKDCYEKALVDHPDLSGRTLVKFKVRGRDGKGVVDEGEIDPDEKDTLDSPATEQCILEVIAKAEFPVSGDGVATVSYPFVLKAAPADDE
jgi:hypothetical protein